MATKRFKHVYQFKIQLKDIKPPIYRIIEVPEYYTFWDLHVAIQDAMGWSDYHLHTFFMKDPAFKTEVELGIPLEDYDENLIPEFLVKISQFLRLVIKMRYIFMILVMNGFIKLLYEKFILLRKIKIILFV